MFKWLFLKFADGYNGSIFGGFWYGWQVKLRNSWDKSALGHWIANGKEGEITRRDWGNYTVPQWLQNSMLLKWLSHYEIFFAILLALAPVASTMICAALAGVTLASFILSRLMLYSKRHITKKSFLSYVIVAFLILTLVYALTSLDIIGSIKVWLIYAIFIVMFFIARQSIKQKRDWVTACWIMVTVGFFISAYGIYQNFFGNNLGHAWTDQTMFSDISVRVYSTLGNPNVLGEYLLLIIPLTIGLVWDEIKNYTREFFKIIRIILLLGFVVTQMLCMVFTQSRGCWIGLVFAAVVFILFVDKRWMALFIVLLCAAPFVLPHSIIQRLSSIGNVGDTSTAYRLDIWMGTLNMLKDFWLTGVGLGATAFAKVYPFYSYSMVTAPHAHDIYLETIAEMGIVGLGILLLITGSFIVLLLRRFVNSTKKTREVILMIAFMAGFLGFMLQGVFDYVWYNYRVFLFFWLFLGIGSMIIDTKEDKPLIENHADKE